MEDMQRGYGEGCLLNVLDQSERKRFPSHAMQAGEGDGAGVQAYTSVTE